MMLGFWFLTVGLILIMHELDFSKEALFLIIIPFFGMGMWWFFKYSDAEPPEY